MIAENGEIQENRERDSSDGKDKRGGLGGVRSSGSVDGLGSVETSSVDSSGQSASGQVVHVECRETTPGKILERLELLEKAFKSYVGGHRQRLEARLDENKQFVETFEEEMQIIKQEVYNLALEESKSTQVSFAWHPPLVSSEESETTQQPTEEIE